MQYIKTFLGAAALAISLSAAANPQTGCDYPLLIAADDFDSLAYCDAQNTRLFSAYPLAVVAALAEFPRLKPGIAKIAPETKSWFAVATQPSPVSCKALPPPPPPFGLELTDEEVAAAEQAVLKQGMLPCTKNMTKFCFDRKHMLMPESRDLRIFLHNIWINTDRLAWSLIVRSSIAENPTAVDIPAARKLLADTAAGMKKPRVPRMADNFAGAALIAPQCYGYKPVF